MAASLVITFFLFTLIPQWVLAGSTQRGHSFARRAHHLSRAASSSGSSGYKLIENYEGQGFYEGFDFYTRADPLHGSVTFNSKPQAISKNLTYVRHDGAFIMTVDAHTHLPMGHPRDSIRISSQKTFGHSLIILDLLSMPHGCSVWPSFWSTSTSDWPQHGEIDMIEGINNQTVNDMNIHTGPGCELDTHAKFTGVVGQGTNCDATGGNHAGCGIHDPDPHSYGHGFNINGGGVLVTLRNNHGVSMWQFSRKMIPADINAGKPNPSAWGTPVALWSSSKCPSKALGDHVLIFDMTLCGDWAGEQETFSRGGCPGTCAQAVTNPANFALAHWAIKSLKVYSVPDNS